MNAAAFTVFAVLTTLHAVRAGSPWQDDPYDAVVSFTKFFVPLLAGIGALRVPLCRAADPMPSARIEQLLRAGLAATLLIALTIGADWLALALRADHQLWNSTTPWLAVSLVPLTGLVCAHLVLHRRVARLLPPRDRTRPADDWLGDLPPLMETLAARLPNAAGRGVPLTLNVGVLGFMRRHFTGLAAAACAAGTVLAITGFAVSEGGFSATVFLLDCLVFLSGTFGFVMVANTALQLVAVPSVGRLRRAGRTAVTTGALTVPMALGLRDAIWSACGLGRHVTTPGQLAAVTLASGLLMGSIAFGIALNNWMSPR
ncbi:hypothetical protein HEP84_39010 [Streptomyces sp. RLB1-33]|uniref:hypothetical protein n=1 Tax=Streptomyces mirabilis TaxID=68239 RepID=UPI00143E1C80|nr:MULTISPECIES: hypothetical protein [Streptomyces]QIY74244.1 hypothetical protein HEP84_39010 [Streptomyces sp. RLB1-33]QUW78793.1 hypothetical protein SMIR_06525 [Streptomyces mirabilis]